MIKVNKKTSKRCHRRRCVFIVNFEHISHLSCVFIVTFQHEIAGWVRNAQKRMISTFHTECRERHSTCFFITELPFYFDHKQLVKLLT